MSFFLYVRRSPFLDCFIYVALYFFISLFSCVLICVCLSCVISLVPSLCVDFFCSFSLLFFPSFFLPLCLCFLRCLYPIHVLGSLFRYFFIALFLPFVMSLLVSLCMSSFNDFIYLFILLYPCYLFYVLIYCVIPFCMCCFRS